MIFINQGQSRSKEIVNDGDNHQILGNECENASQVGMISYLLLHMWKNRPSNDILG